MVGYSEQGVVIHSGENRLVGVAALPRQDADVAVLILVGGPQYRVGSHRQFARLARGLAEQGVPSLRFDYTGMGDSEGEPGDFHAVENDIGAALDTLAELLPQLRKVVLWGLCDAASAAMMHAAQWPQVAGMVLLNPWVHSGDYSPEVKLSRYYAPLLKGKDTWRRVFSGQLEVGSSVKAVARESVQVARKIANRTLGMPSSHEFVEAMLEGLERFSGHSLIIVSEQDLTAREFMGLVNNDRRWQRLISGDRISLFEVSQADHTFSRKIWQEQVLEQTLSLVRTLGAST